MTAPTPISTTTLRDLASRASRNPWEWHTSNSFRRMPGIIDPIVHSDGQADIGIHYHDMDWIAAANPAAILSLLDRLERAEALIRACRLVQDLDVSRYPLCNSDLAGINEAFRAYDTAAKAPRGAGE